MLRLALVLLLAAPTPARAEPPDPAPTPTGWQEVADAQGAVGFVVARDAGVRLAARPPNPPEVRLAALRRLADTARLTGDWGVVEAEGAGSPEPFPGCQCDELAWHVGRGHLRAGRTAAGWRWLDSIARDSRFGARVTLLRKPHPPDDPERAADEAALLPLLTDPEVGPSATLRLARLRCARGDPDGGFALLTPMPRSATVALAEAWCAVDGGVPGRVAAPLPTLQASAETGAWLPSLGYLAARAQPTAAAESAQLDSVVRDLTALQVQLERAAHQHALGVGPDGAGWDLPAASGAPAAVRVTLQQDERRAGIARRLDRLAAERGSESAANVRADLDAETVDAQLRGAAVVQDVLRTAASEVAFLAEVARSRRWDLDRPAGPPDAEALRALATAELRALLANPEMRLGATATARAVWLEHGDAGTPAAIAELAAALSAHPLDQDSLAAEWRLTLLQVDAGRYAEAETTLSRALPRVGTRHLGYTQALLGELAFARGAPAAALARYTAAADADPSLRPYATYRRAWCHWALGQPRLAAAALDAVLADATTPAALERAAKAERRRLSGCRPGVECKR